MATCGLPQDLSEMYEDWYIEGVGSHNRVVVLHEVPPTENGIDHAWTIENQEVFMVISWMMEMMSGRKH